MAEQDAFNIVIGIAGFLAAWMINNLTKEIDTLRKEDHIVADKVQKIELLVAGEYVRNSQLKRFEDAVFTTLGRIESKLDGKVDK